MRLMPVRECGALVQQIEERHGQSTWRMVPALWLSRDHPSNYWIAVDSDFLMRDHKHDVELRMNDRWYLR